MGEEDGAEDEWMDGLGNDEMFTPFSLKRDTGMMMVMMGYRKISHEISTTWKKSTMKAVVDGFFLKSNKGMNNADFSEYTVTYSIYIVHDAHLSIYPTHPLQKYILKKNPLNPTKFEIFPPPLKFFFQIYL